MSTANKDNLVPDAFLDVDHDSTVASHSIPKPKPQAAQVKAEGPPTDVEKIFSAIQTNLSEDLVNKVSSSSTLYKSNGIKCFGDWYA